MEQQFDLFGFPIAPKKETLMDKYIEPPFSVIDSRQGRWQQRKNRWRSLGIKSEVGRKATAIHGGTDDYRAISKREDYNNREEYTSIFDPVLCEIMYKWFCPEGGKILDPFAGGSVRGIVAGHLGYKYIGIDIRQEQIDSNNEQANAIGTTIKPTYICGDSREVLANVEECQFDLVFSCPPYVNLETYSKLQGDISNMEYAPFYEAYSDIIRQSCDHLRRGGMQCLSWVK